MGSFKWTATAFALAHVILRYQVTGANPEARARHLEGSTYYTRFPNVTWDNEAWTLTTTNPSNDDWRAQSFVANGYIGSTFVSTGPFSHIWPESNGNPMFENRSTFGTVAGFFDAQDTVPGDWFTWLRQYGGDSVISGLPSWGSLMLDLGNGAYLNDAVDEGELSDVTLRQDFKRGLASYGYTWTPANLDGAAVDVTYTVFAHKLHPNRAFVQMDVSANKDINATIVSIFDGSTALRTDFSEKGVRNGDMHTAVRPTGIKNVTAWIYSTLTSSAFDKSALHEITNRPYISNDASTMAQGVSIALSQNQSVNITKVIGIASTDGFSDPKAQAHNEMRAGVQDGFPSALEQHIQEWAAVFPSTSVTSFADPNTGILPDHLIDRQITTVVASAMLLMNTVSENAVESVDNAPINNQGISVCGLFSDCYGGHRFWDQDLWMAPYLAATHPFEAKQIPLSRVLQYDDARRNIQTAYTSSQRDTYFSPDAAIYAWSVGRDGNCSALGPCWDNEYHLNGDIARGFITYWIASGDDEFVEKALLPITKSIATLFSNLLQLDDDTGTWNLNNMTDPDENAGHKNDGAFTMSLIQWTLLTTNQLMVHYGHDMNETWNRQARDVRIPMAYGENITLEFPGMTGSIIAKQADVNLRTYPLNNLMNYSIANQRGDLGYYSSKISPGGPAMTWAIFSIVSSLLSPSGCPSYTYDKESWSDYLSGPYYGFAEGVDANYQYSSSYPFLTGYGGFLQIDLMGYLGLRYEMADALQLFPNLPPQIPHIRFPTFYYRGWPISAEATPQGFSLTRLNQPLATADRSYRCKAIKVDVTLDENKDHTRTFRLPPGKTVRLPNYSSATELAVANNILQCRPIVGSKNGELPEAAIDGFNGTTWQLDGATARSSLTVDLKGAKSGLVKQIYIDWAASVAKSFSVIFHNGSDSDYRSAASDSLRTIQSGNISISQPYNASAQSIVKPYLGNSTMVNIVDKEIWTTRWVTLLVEGTQDSVENGATVAEWAVIVP